MRLVLMVAVVAAIAMIAWGGGSAPWPSCCP